METISKSETETVLDLDFSLDIPSDQFRDIAGSDNCYDLINAPAIAVTSYDRTRAPYGYGAIHFHDDDLDDAVWETDFKL